MMRVVALLSACLVTLSAPASGAELTGDYLYKVTSVRAAPGKLKDLLDHFTALKSSGYYAAAGAPAPFIMRHSQGDQWDILLIAPMESWSAYHKPRASASRAKAAQTFTALLAGDDALIAFSEDHFAFGPPVGDVSGAFAANGFFHIEMFNAAPGKAGELFVEREMENAYLAATGQRENMIFWVEAGGDVDVFTIGFHPSLEAFAAPSPMNDEEKEAAAKAAGFKDRADISFYLRSLISGHHDTLATKVE